METKLTNLRINVAELKDACIGARQCEPEPGESIYAHFRFFVKDAIAWGRIVRKSANKADTLRAQLEVAARAAYHDGATASQINYIVSLASKKGDYNILSGGRLTRHEASRIIDVMK